MTSTDQTPESDEPPMHLIPAARMSEAHVADAIRRFEAAEAWRRRWGRIRATGRFARRGLDGGLRGVGWLVEWWPKLWRALVALPPLLLLLEQLGLPVVSLLRAWVEQLIASGDGGPAS